MQDKIKPRISKRATEQEVGTGILNAEKAAIAFESYYAMGPDRTLEQLAIDVRLPYEIISDWNEALNYIERLKRIRNRFNEFGIVLEEKYEDYAAALMAREMDKPKKLDDKYKLLDKFAKKIKATVDERGSKLIHEDIRLIFEK